MLDALEAAAEHEHRDATAAAGTGCRRGTPASSSAAAMPANSAQVVPRLATTSAPSAAHRAADAVALADQPGEPLPGDDAHPRAELVEEDERAGRERQHPEQLVAVVGAEDRVRRDPGRVVVGEPGEQARAGDRGECDQAATAQHAA